MSLIDGGYRKCYNSIYKSHKKRIYTMVTSNKQDKWLLVSCLQKSIRKGYTNLALEYADELYELERAYLLYRLSIIAVEDIGYANLDVVHDFMTTEIKKANIEERGGKDYVMSIVEKLANSPKDRSACDLTYLSAFYKPPTDIESSSLESIFVNREENIVSRLLAGWEVLGNKKQKNPFVQNEVDDIDRFIELNKQITQNEKVLDIIKAGYKFQREPHFIAMGLLDFLYNEESKAGTKVGKFNVGDVIESKLTPVMCGYQNRWLIDGLDWHTAEGKRAIYDFVAQRPPVVEYLRQFNSNNDFVAQTIGSLFFRENGHKVDKRLVYPSAVVILKACTTKSIKAKIDNQDIAVGEAMKLMTQDVSILYNIIENKQRKPNMSRMPF